MAFLQFTCQLNKEGIASADSRRRLDVLLMKGGDWDWAMKEMTQKEEALTQNFGVINDVPQMHLPTAPLLWYTRTRDDKQRTFRSAIAGMANTARYTLCLQRLSSTFWPIIMLYLTMTRRSEINTCNVLKPSYQTRTILKFTALFSRWRLL